MREQNNFEALADTLLGSNDILSEANDQCAAGMYRAMFRHEMDINKLDYEYTDHILDCVYGGVEAAEEDYRNYLQYLKCFNKEEYLAHKEMLENALNLRVDDQESSHLGVCKLKTRVRTYPQKPEI